MKYILFFTGILDLFVFAISNNSLILITGIPCLFFGLDWMYNEKKYE